MFGQNIEEHFQCLGQVLCKLKAANLKVKPSKCNVFAPKVQYLGHVISAEGFRPILVKCRPYKHSHSKESDRGPSFFGIVVLLQAICKGLCRVGEALT